MTRIICAVVFLLTFPLLLALAGLVSVLRGMEAGIRWVSDIATPLVFKMAEIADGTAIEDQQ